MNRQSVLAPFEPLVGAAGSSESAGDLLFPLAWFGLLLCTSLIFLLIQVRRSNYSPWENCLYLPTYLMGRLLWRVHFSNDAPEQIASGALLVANHRSSVDPFFVQLAARRRVHWMVAKEYCNHPLFGKILLPLQVIPTNRSGMDIDSTREAMRITRAGRLVGMFPEGRINRTRHLLLALRSGAGLIAVRSEVPIIPLFIEGSPFGGTVWSPVMMPAHVRITFGEPIFPPAAASSSQEPNQKELPQCANGRAEDRMILEWGREILRMAEQPQERLELASMRHRRRRSSSADRPQPADTC